MTQTVDISLPAARSSEIKFVRTICFAHFVSHYYITLLAPLFLFVRDDYGVSNTQLGLALTAFSATSALLQTPTGFLVDRTSGRMLLVAGLLLGAVAVAIAAIVDSFWVFVAMFALSGLATTVYHPADYALLSHHVPAERIGRAFSLHTFAGMLGNAAAPPTLLLMNSFMGWRGAFMGAAVLGVIGALVVLLQSEPPPVMGPDAQTGKPQVAPHVGRQLLLSMPILLCLLFFILSAISGGGLNNFLVVTLGALYATPPAVSNTALTGLLLLSAIGVLAGGWLTGLTSRHGLVAAAGLVVTAVSVLLVGVFDFPAVVLVLLMSTAGFFSGITMPSRDMIVRALTPHGAYGRVYGFVSTGFNIGSIVSPLIFGQLLDHGNPRAIFLTVVACTVISIATVMVNTSRRPGDA